ncbi:pyruvate kinase [Marinobacter nauticus]|uniref:pyruvate kinase n=1 Tax=Marinobacter nauticus (strain ATCC 700491 / DSM 11845 / VT8) TaxID=351348 RepID=A1U878_MARN8|nr:pyruvate kinase [Marinobacter nauticus]ABM21197.1 pyruvate kinase [Marinobacter nauticus VT8]
MEETSTLTPFEIEEVGSLLDALKHLRDTVTKDAAGHRNQLEHLDPAYVASAKNLLHYLSLRQHDIRPLQQRLALLGLSSLGRAESCVLPTLHAVIRVLAAILGQQTRIGEKEDDTTFTIEDGSRLLSDHADQLLGTHQSGRTVRIMVTMPTEAGHDPTIIHQLMAKGMDCMRINCAHDSPEIWQAMIRNLRTAEQSLGRNCRIFMDLGGPKIRTGGIEPGAKVVHVRPKRDDYGITVIPARVWLTSSENPSVIPEDCAAQFQVSESFLKCLNRCDEITLTDARKKSRKWTVVDITESGCCVESIKACYIRPGITIRLKNGRQTPRVQTEIQDFPPQEGVLRLKKDDMILVTSDLVQGHNEERDTAGNLIKPATVSCTMPAVAAQVRPGETIWFDDGKIGGVIEKTESDQFWVRIHHARPEGSKLRSAKGINLPDSQLNINALTDEDLRNLAFIAEHADVVEMSFANSIEDVQLLQEQLKKLGAETLPIVLKVETRKGFENLPRMLLAAMRWPCCGVMIARGDLAVECGYERLAEVQEEILSVCEAAHVPVIWATQVLENFARKGVPSRAEISDAVMAHRAECVMLNKGPYIIQAVEALDNILKRMQSHQKKRRPMLRELRLAHLAT